MFKTKYKVMKVKRNGVYRFVPMVRTSFLGFGKWIEDPGWAVTQRNAAEERKLGLETDSTLTQCRAFIERKDMTNLNNKFYKPQFSTRYILLRCYILE